MASQTQIESSRWIVVSLTIALSILGVVYGLKKRREHRNAAATSSEAAERERPLLIWQQIPRMSHVTLIEKVSSNPVFQRSSLWPLWLNTMGATVIDVRTSKPSGNWVAPKESTSFKIWGTQSSRVPVGLRSVPSNSPEHPSTDATLAFLVSMPGSPLDKDALPPLEMGITSVAWRGEL